MKSGHRTKAFRLWRAGQTGLKTIQALVDKLIAEAPDQKELVFSGLPDLKIRISKEVRENYLAELRSRREELELQDLELSRKMDVGLLMAVKARIEGALKQLLDLEELKQALALDKGTSEAPQPQQSEPPESVATDVEVQPAEDKDQDTQTDEGHEALTTSEQDVGPAPQDTMGPEHADTSQNTEQHDA